MTGTSHRSVQEGRENVVTGCTRRVATMHLDHTPEGKALSAQGFGRGGRLMAMETGGISVNGHSRSWEGLP